MSLYSQKRQEIKENIFKSAVRLFKEKDYYGVSVKDITQDVGIAKGTFYNYYSSKREILLLWSREKFINLDIRSVIDREKSIEQNLYSLIEVLTHKIEGDEDLFTSFLKEFMMMYYENPSGKRLNLKQVLYIVISASKDFNEIGEDYIELKVKVLKNAIFMELVDWFFQEKELEGLEQVLRDTVKVTLHGLLKNIA
ncbi:MAG: TetR/AcrR family transcriptional regulator [Halanaerobiales bacterium]